MKDIVDPEKYSEMLDLQAAINSELAEAYLSNRGKGREHLAKLLAEKINQIVAELNSAGRDFVLCEYSADVNFENSEQLFSEGPESGVGLILRFCGFSVQAAWEGSDKYA